jgi:HEPN domain-containing protein
MSDHNQDIFQQVLDWVAYAEDDMRLAKYALTLTEGCPYRLIAYHAQQCVEKYLKAYLVYHGIDFPYTHDISDLLESCGRTANWVEEIQDAEELTFYAVATRYPRRGEQVNEEEAVRSVQIAERVCQVIRISLINEGMRF